MVIIEVGRDLGQPGITVGVAYTVAARTGKQAALEGKNTYGFGDSFGYRQRAAIVGKGNKEAIVACSNGSRYTPVENKSRVRGTVVQHRGGSARGQVIPGYGNIIAIRIMGDNREGHIVGLAFAGLEHLLAVIDNYIGIGRIAGRIDGLAVIAIIQKYECHFPHTGTYGIAGTDLVNFIGYDAAVSRLTAGIGRGKAHLPGYGIKIEGAGRKRERLIRCVRCIIDHRGHGLAGRRGEAVTIQGWCHAESQTVGIRVYRTEGIGIYFAYAKEGVGDAVKLGEEFWPLTFFSVAIRPVVPMACKFWIRPLLPALEATSHPPKTKSHLAPPSSTTFLE